MSVICGVQGAGQILSNNYEGLDAADMDAPPPPHQYSGLGVHAPGPQMDQHGYLVVVGDPKYGEQPQVSTDITGPRLDQHGYLVVVGDPKYGEQPQVSTDITGWVVALTYHISHSAKNRKRQISTQKPLSRFRRNLELVSSTTHIVVSDNVYDNVYTKMNTTSASPPT